MLKDTTWPAFPFPIGCLEQNSRCGELYLKLIDKKGWLVRSQGFKGKGSGAKEDPSPASKSIIINKF